MPHFSETQPCLSDFRAFLSCLLISFFFLLGLGDVKPTVMVVDEDGLSLGRRPEFCQYAYDHLIKGYCLSILGQVKAPDLNCNISVNHIVRRIINWPSDISVSHVTRATGT